MSLPASSQLKNTLKKEKNPQPPLQWEGEILLSSQFSCPVLSLLSSPKLLRYIQLIRNESSSKQTWVSLKGMVNISPP